MTHIKPTCFYEKTYSNSYSCILGCGISFHYGVLLILAASFLLPFIFLASPETCSCEVNSLFNAQKVKI
uniref:Uncharacterized protein n=1 Tax=Rhizophora mucronata TaxID=61149 RepID=A0A2P2J4P6_RHIMU